MSERIVGLAGDWHGSTAWAQEAIRVLAKSAVSRIYHLGDFGVWPGDRGAAYLDHVDATLRFFNLELWVTPGNHEDWDQINALRFEAGLAAIRPHIRIIERGHRWTDGERTFVSLGGAPSIDFEHRIEGVSWWRSEVITLTEAEAVATGGYADVMLTHDAPDGGTNAVQSIIETPPDKSPWTPGGLAYANEGRQIMNLAVEGVKPLLFAHGHYHAPDDTGPRDGTRFLSFGCDGQPMNVALLRLADLAVSWDGQVWR